ncbi:MAG: glycoside hydrolase family 127 protein [Candidatus Heimdallarchaeota archaeon]
MKFSKSKPLKIDSVKIEDNFWNKRYEINNSTAIFYQWEQLEKTHNQDNFRVLAGLKDGYRFGFFYCDSDLHKWADAAARILVLEENKELSKIIREYIDLMQMVQEEDGYLYTYNQFHFPNRRWANLQIEHELYCLGHLIEAAVSYSETNEPEKYKKEFLGIAIKAADLLVTNFRNASPKFTPGHQEIEIALIRLYRLTQKKKYLDLASHFLFQRGKINFYGLRLISQAQDQKKRTKYILKDMHKKKIKNEWKMSFFGGETKHQKEAPFLGLRSFFQFFTGRYHQQNAPIKKMKRPFGHSVRWGYLVTAMAMLYQETGSRKILRALQRTWEHLVQKQMFITGGIGALGSVEGFGRDYELRSDYSYCETCAAIANILLNWELALITNKAKYSDLLEWQVYNALSVGIGLNGTSYLYRNLLEASGNLSREAWFATPCCPSNVSRIWASIGQYIYSHSTKEIWIHQFIGNSTKINLKNDQSVKIKVNSELPYNGRIRLEVVSSKPKQFAINIRIPSWTQNPIIIIDGDTQLIHHPKENRQTGSGFSPNNSQFYSITQDWSKGSIIELDFPMKINIHNAHPKVRNNRNKIALSRGPLVYCFESIDNPDCQIPNESIDLTKEIIPEFNEKILSGVFRLKAKNKANRTLIAIPYYTWANRNPSSMQIWIKKK